MLVTLHPTKEQVRAYMHAREFDRRPPPQPDEIRRQLGWRCDAADASADIHPSSAFPVFLPGTIAQLATLLAVEWCFLAVGVSRPS